MTTDTIYFDSEKKVSFTSYILDTSKEMPNMKTRPAILVLPGGGYSMCSDREAEPVAMAFLSKGYNAFVLRYSVKENSAFPRPLNEAEKALSMIRSNAKEYHVDPSKIAVIGFSAGGHLAAALATMGSVRPDACILGYPCILSSIGKVLYNPVPSLEKEVDKKTPPCYIFSTANDNTVPIENSLEFATALNKNKVPFEIHIFANGNHGLSLANSVTSGGNKGAENEEVSVWFPMCMKWLKGIFGEK